MRVGLVTNFNQACSISEYAKNLLSHLPSDIDVKVISQPHTLDNVINQLHDVDVIHFNYIAYRMNHGLMEGVVACRDRKKQKMVITYQETPGEYQLYNGVGGLADAIVLHEPSGNYGPKVHLIPNGIKLVDVKAVEPQNKLGSAGFYSLPKRFDLVHDAASQLHMGCLLLMPKADCGGDAPSFGGSEILRDYLPYDNVVQRLAECLMTIFPYDDSYPMVGIGNAVRFGLAAERPVIVSKHHHFRDLLQYNDEVYFIDQDVTTTVRKVLDDIMYGVEKLPKRLLQDMNWTRCAQMYANVYRNVQ